MFTLSDILVTPGGEPMEGASVSVATKHPGYGEDGLVAAFSVPVIADETGAFSLTLQDSVTAVYRVVVKYGPGNDVVLDSTFRPTGADMTLSDVLEQTVPNEILPANGTVVNLLSSAPYRSSRVYTASISTEVTVDGAAFVTMGAGTTWVFVKESDGWASYQAGAGSGGGGGGGGSLSAPVPVVGNTTPTSFTVSWSPVSGANSYDLRLDGATVTTGVSSPRTVSGLAPSTSGTVELRSVGATTSGWSTPVGWATSAAPATVVRMTINSSADCSVTESGDSGAGWSYTLDDTTAAFVGTSKGVTSVSADAIPTGGNGRYEFSLSYTLGVRSPEVTVTPGATGMGYNPGGCVGIYIDTDGALHVRSGSTDLNGSGFGLPTAVQPSGARWAIGREDTGGTSPRVYVEKLNGSVWDRLWSVAPTQDFDLESCHLTSYFWVTSCYGVLGNVRRTH